MKSFCVAAAAALAALIVQPAAAQTQPSRPLAIPGGTIAKDLAGAKELPDPKLIYKVVFMAGSAAPTPDAVNPSLKEVSEYVNTLAAHGVAADHRKIAIVIHQGATPMILNNEAFRAKYGRDNPDLPMIQSMSKAGVAFYVCG